MCSYENVCQKFDTPKSSIRVPKRTSFSSFCIYSCRKMLQNTPKHHLVTNGVYLVCLSENVRRKFDTPKPCIRVTKCNNFSSFCIHSCIKMLHYTPKHHYGYNRGYWVCSCENFRRNFGTTKPCIRVPKRTSFSSFCMLRGSEMLQTTPKHHFGSNRGYLGVFLRKHSSEV